MSSQHDPEKWKMRQPKTPYYVRNTMQHYKCPKCGARISEYTLCSMPPQYEAECKEGCGFVLRFFDRKDRFAWVTQDELEDFYESRRDKNV